MSKPTVGAPVLFHPAANQNDPDFAAARVCAGTIALVHNDTLVNLGVLDGDGVAHGFTSVPFISGYAGGESAPQDGFWCEPMTTHHIHGHVAPMPVDPTAQRTDAPGWKDPNAPTI